MNISVIKANKNNFFIALIITCFLSVFAVTDIFLRGTMSVIQMGSYTLYLTHIVAILVFGVLGLMSGFVYEFLIFFLTFLTNTNYSFLSFIFLALGIETYCFIEKKWFESPVKLPLITLCYSVTAGPVWFLIYTVIARLYDQSNFLHAFILSFLGVIPECLVSSVLLYMFFNVIPESVRLQTPVGLVFTRDDSKGSSALFTSKFGASIILSRIINFSLLGFCTVVFFYVLNKDKYLESYGKLPADILRFILCIFIVSTPSVYVSNLVMEFQTIAPLRSLTNFLTSYVLISDDMRSSYARKIVEVEPRGQNEFHDLYNAVHILVSSIQDYVDRIKANSHLQDELRIAEAASEAKSSFLSNMSHEIRTPINSIIGMDEIILREVKDPAIRQYANNIQKSSKILIQLINDILDFSKIEAGKMEILPDEYDLSGSIADLCNMTRVKAVDKNLDFIVDVNPETPFSLFGDEIRVKQCALNILTNGVKYTKQGAVTFIVDYEKLDDDHINLIIKVKDTGIGIKEEDIKKLCTPFQRIEENRNRTIEGTGLGMSIVKSLLEMMGTHIEVESEYGKGSTFIFKVKQRVLSWEAIGDFTERDKKASQSASNYVEQFHAPDAHILVVDDVKLNLDVIKGLLKPTKIQVDLAESGREMLEMTNKKVYDLIFIDHRMPGMDGVEALQAMKSSQQSLNTETPCVALTANAVSGAKDLYIDSGFNNYLSKPVDSVQLEKMVMDYLPPGLILREGDPGFEKDNEPDTELEEVETLDDEKMITLEKCKGIDLQIGLRYCQTSDILFDAVKNYYTMIESKAILVMELMNSENWKDYTTQVHALKSSSRMIGAQQLSDRAAYLELCGNEGKIDDIRSLTPVFIEEYKNYLQNLAPIAEETNANDAEQISEEQLSEVFSSIKKYLDDFDWDGVDAEMEKLSKFMIPAAYKEKINKINEMVVSVDRDGLLALL